MSFKTLDLHEKIGWDFDGTIHDHPRSQAMHEYILANPHKKHYIVTFRSHGWEKRVFGELADYVGAPSAQHFVKVINIDGDLYEGYHRALRSYPGDINYGDIVTYLEWKGSMCAQHGITVLIDDLTDMVIEGCQKYGIVHIHPDSL